MVLALMSFIAVQNLTVEFPGVRALGDVSIDFRPGEVHSIIGENGAGKSTFMRTLAGLQMPTEGTVVLAGEPVRFKNAGEAMAAGIMMIHQELNLVDDLTVAENVFLGREPRNKLRLIDRGEMIRETRELLARLRVNIDPREMLGNLSVARQQMVEIAKAISHETPGEPIKMIIMDEPTAVLGERESVALFDLIRRLREAGTCIVYVSHRLPEVLALSDRISVLRDGQYVTTLDGDTLAAADEKKLASLMVGRPMADHFPERHSPGEQTVLEVENITVPGEVHGVSFAVKAGEIFGLAGLVGAGRTETAEAIAGLKKRSAGTVKISGDEVRIRNVADAKKAGLAYVSEDRKAAGLTLSMSIRDNTTLATLKKYAHPLLSAREEREAALRHAGQLRTKFAHTSDAVSTLSGGNQQKVALAKWLDSEPVALILDEPTRGVDIGAKEEIYRVIQGLADAGMACVVISSELPELLGLCHRIGVMHEGRLVEVVDGPSATEESIMHAASGLVQA